MSERKTLHFSFGSPQRFIAQARRTRDLWAGSYLLSWLCGRAMAAIVERGATIQLPDVSKDPLFAQIRSPRPVQPDEPEAHLGSLPARFTAVIPEGADAEECARACEEAVSAAWSQVVGAVRKIVESQLGEQQDEIWRRQTEKFWSSLWVIGDAPLLLEQRKQLGPPLPPGEPGMKCTVCAERQELSGTRNRTEAADWWTKTRDLADVHDLDLRPNERLCAVCLVKRLFPRVAQSAIGWEVPKFYPSTAYVSAIDWLNRLLDLAREHEAVRRAIGTLLGRVPEAIVRREEARNWSPIRSIAEKLEDLPELRGIQAMSGSVFFEDDLRGDALKIHDPEGAIQALKALQKAVEEAEKEDAGEEVGESIRATPFYALLMMDGDGMGELFATHPLEQQQALARALAVFNRQVPQIVRRCDGWLIYAAGEDVFALLPVSQALGCAHEVRRAYRQALLEEASFVGGTRATLSAAINFVHMNTALGTVVQDTHNSLLDGVAKDAAGRDAIACRVWKRGGPIFTWVQPWALSTGGLLPEAARARYARGFYSSGLFYKLEGLFRMHKGAGGPFDDTQLRDLLIAEYLANRERNAGVDTAEAAFHVDLLLRLCRWWRREVTPEGAALFHPGGFSDSGAQLVRFLHQKEV
jgi:CRISPR-associated protein Cmr2